MPFSQPVTDFIGVCFGLGVLLFVLWGFAIFCMICFDWTPPGWVKKVTTRDETKEEITEE